MDKIKIGYDYNAEQLDRKNAPIKEGYYQALVEYFNRYELNIPIDTLNFSDTFVIEFEKMHRDAFPSFVTLEKMLELSSVNLDEIRTIERHYYSIPEVDKDQDYNIYAITEREIVSYDLSAHCLSIVDEFEGLFGKMSQKQYNELCILFKGLITTDRRTGERSINPQRIKNI